MSLPEALPWVAFPERLDRRLRLGPFASGRDLLKFVTGAAVGAVVGLTVAVGAGAAIAAAAAVVALYRPGGEPVDERLAALARWELRRAGIGGSMTPPPAPRADGARTLTLADGRSAALLRTGGVPLAFLPPEELARQLELYRTALRAVDGAVVTLATSSPLFAGDVTPVAGPANAEDEAARAGYGELVRLIASRRAARRVFVAVARDARGAEAGARLETAVGLLADRLRELGLSAERLDGRALRDAARRLGWGSGEEGR